MTRDKIAHICSEEIAMNNTVCFYITNDKLFTVGNVIIGLERYCPNFFNYIIVVEDRNELNRQELNSLRSIVHQNYYNPNRLTIININELPIDKILSLQGEGIKKFIKRWSIMPLAKILLINIFDDNFAKSIGIEKTPDSPLLLDNDILITRDIKGLFNYGDICGALGANARKLLPDNIFPEISNSDIKPNGGVILIKKEFFNKICQHDYNSIIIKIIEELSIHDILGIEEHLLLILSKKFNIKFDILSDEWNWFPQYSRHTNPAIIHSLGKNKFWSNPLINIMFPEWERNNRIWLSSLLQAGISSSEIHKFNHSVFNHTTRSKCISTYDWSIFWHDILDKIKFSHNAVYQQTDISGRYVQFYIKNDNINKNLHYEILSEGGGFTVALHLENKYLFTNTKLVNFIESIKEPYCYIHTSDTISLERKFLKICDINEVLTHLIDITWNFIIESVER